MSTQHGHPWKRFAKLLNSAELQKPNISAFPANNEKQAQDERWKALDNEMRLAIERDDERENQQAERSKAQVTKREVMLPCFTGPRRQCDSRCPDHGESALARDGQFFGPGISTTSVQTRLGLEPNTSPERIILTPTLTQDDYKLLLLVLSLAARLPQVKTNGTLLRKLHSVFNRIGEPVGLAVQNIDALAHSFPEPTAKIQGKITAQFKKAFQVHAEPIRFWRRTTEELH